MEMDSVGSKEREDADRRSLPHGTAEAVEIGEGVYGIGLVESVVGSSEPLEGDAMNPTTFHFVSPDTPLNVPNVSTLSRWEAEPISAGLALGIIVMILGFSLWWLRGRR